MPPGIKRADPISALDWYATMPAPRLARHEPDGHLSMCRFTGTAAEMHQPALSENIVCMHLGGAKTVRRWQGDRQSVHDVELGALTIMPAHQVNRWLTAGPVDFAHLTLSAALLAQVAVEEFDQEPRGCELIDLVGRRDPYVEALFLRLLAAIEQRDTVGRLYPDSLLVVLTTVLLADHAQTAGGGAMRRQALVSKGGLAAWRLRRVTDYMQANITSDVALSELTALTGLSRAQFFRAFRQATGLSPNRYLAELRLERAKALLQTSALTLDEVGEATGLGVGPAFAARFRQRFGMTPRLFRMSHA